jgi:WhiB family transcriptional regulator, redox-sensing transcriptional regulator
MFVPSLGGKFGRARELCRSCTVRQQCLDFALADEDMAGMFGGTLAKERQAMRGSGGAA